MNVDETSKQRLRQRWIELPGNACIQLVTKALVEGTSTAELRMLILTLPFLDEVSPALDLRGYSFPQGLPLRGVDLSAVRLDYAVLNGPLIDCCLSHAVCDGADAE